MTDITAATAAAVHMNKPGQVVAGISPNMSRTARMEGPVHDLTSLRLRMGLLPNGTSPFPFYAE